MLYHNTSMPLMAKQLSEICRVKVASVSFSEAQNEKGPYEQKAGNVKLHVLRYLNEGNDVSTATELKKVIESHGGITNCKTFLCEILMSLQMGKCRLTNIGRYHNFSMTEGEMTVWYAYNIGRGHSLPWNRIVPKRGHDRSNASAIFRYPGAPAVPRRDYHSQSHFMTKSPTH